jgi:hypothetical protein
VDFSIALAWESEVEVLEGVSDVLNPSTLKRIRKSRSVFVTRPALLRCSWSPGRVQPTDAHRETYILLLQWLEPFLNSFTTLSSVRIS